LERQDAHLDGNFTFEDLAATSNHSAKFGLPPNFEKLRAIEAEYVGLKSHAIYFDLQIQHLAYEPVCAVESVN